MFCRLAPIKASPYTKGQCVKIFKSAFLCICIVLNEMKLTRVIETCENIFAMKMVLIFLTFQEQDLTKDIGCIMLYV